MFIKNISRLILVYFVSGILLSSSGAYAWTGDAQSTATPVTIIGTAEECKTAQQGLKDDFEAYIKDLQKPDPEYKKVQDEIDTFREKMREKKTLQTNP